MQLALSITQDESSRAITLVSNDDFDDWLAASDARTKQWLASVEFKAKANAHCLIPDDDAKIGRVIAVVDKIHQWSIAALPSALPSGHYHLDGRQLSTSEEAALGAGWVLAQYRFTQFKGEDSDSGEPRILTLGEGAVAEATRIAHATTLARDLINTPTEALSPLALSDVCRDVANECGASIDVIVGDDLLVHRYPAVHVVGRAADRPSCLVDLRWGDESHPKVTLVGKGVCFDTGGLNLKPAGGMRLMKKDMGGAAHAIALGQLIMQSSLPIRLRVLIPAVENAVSGNAYRPGDVINTRAGITVEVDNTDAEGRIILCDALSAACEESPELIVDFATLTGAARVALGPEVPAMFVNDDEVAAGIAYASAECGDPVWRMPLHQDYRAMLDSNVGDMVNSAASPFGGAITAALYLERFIEHQTPWVHFDLMAWNIRKRPGRPEGGEAMGLRAVFEYLKARYTEQTSTDAT